MARPRTRRSATPTAGEHTQVSAVCSPAIKPTLCRSFAVKRKLDRFKNQLGRFHPRPLLSLGLSAVRCRARPFRPAGASGLSIDCFLHRMRSVPPAVHYSGTPPTHQDLVLLDCKCSRKRTLRSLKKFLWPPRGPRGRKKAFLEHPKKMSSAATRP